MSHADFANWTIPLVAMPDQEKVLENSMIAVLLCRASKFKRKFDVVLLECWIQMKLCLSFIFSF